MYTKHCTDAAKHICWCYLMMRKGISEQVETILQHFKSSAYGAAPPSDFLQPFVFQTQLYSKYKPLLSLKHELNP